MNEKHDEGSNRPSMNKAQKIRYGIVLATILSICLVLATWFLVLQSPPPRTDGGPRILYSQIPLGVKFTLSGNLNTIVNWGDLIVFLSDGTNITSWSNVTTQDLKSSEKSTTWHYGSPKSLGLVSVWLNITDYAGDGRLDSGDTVFLTTGGAAQFFSDTNYGFYLVYRPTAGSVFEFHFWIH